MSALRYPFRTISLIFLLVVILPTPDRQAQTIASAPYATKVSFKKGVLLRFTDFDLTYLGERRESSTLYPHGFLFHDFKAEHAAETVKVAWSAGTGDIGPSVFIIGWKKFQLELKRSDKLGKLKDDELVVQPVR